MRVTGEQSARYFYFFHNLLIPILPSSFITAVPTETSACMFTVGSRFDTLLGCLVHCNPMADFGRLRASEV